MSTTKVSDDVWYRCVPQRWKTPDGFRSDIRPSVLEDARIQRALFIVAPETDEEFGVFIPMNDIRRVLEDEIPGKNGSIAFSVCLATSTIKGQKITCRKAIAT